MKKQTLISIKLNEIFEERLFKLLFIKKSENLERAKICVDK